MWSAWSFTSSFWGKFSSSWSSNILFSSPKFPIPIPLTLAAYLYQNTLVYTNHLVCYSTIQSWFQGRSARTLISLRSSNYFRHHDQTGLHSTHSSLLRATQECRLCSSSQLPHCFIRSYFNVSYVDLRHPAYVTLFYTPALCFYSHTRSIYNHSSMPKEL